MRDIAAVTCVCCSVPAKRYAVKTTGLKLIIPVHAINVAITLIPTSACRIANKSLRGITTRMA